MAPSSPTSATRQDTRTARRRGFSLAELLVVIGVIALLIAILLPPLKLAKRQANATRCATQLQQIGVALEAAQTEYRFYPIWDDGGSPMRFTWIDVLIQRRLLGDVRIGYCPEDPRPEPLNMSRAEALQIYYPGEQLRPGIDYSYGIGVPLASGAWAWRPEVAPPTDTRPRQFVGHDRYTSSRLLAADANWSAIYNMSGDALATQDWSNPTQFDNTISWRHRENAANILYQDGHVSRLVYNVQSEHHVNTAATFVWYPGEPLHVGPDDAYAGSYYPLYPAVSMASIVDPAGADVQTSGVPREMVPLYYTQNRLWTQIEHK